LSFFDLFDKNKKAVKSTQITMSITEEINSKEPDIDKIEISVSTKNGLGHYQSDVAKWDGDNNVLVIIVGMNGSIKGYENKYFKIAKRANKIYGSTVFIFANDERNWYDPKIFFNAVMQYVRENTLAKNDLKIKLFCFSAGAAFASYYAWKYPEITNLLLVNPPLIDYLELTINGVRSFSGNSTLVVGKNDPSYKLGELFTLDQYSDIFNNVILFDGADHYFTGLLDEFINLPFQYLYDRISLYL
jgi:pimeloyl-ACP methyl ester carboxylesterase